MKKNIEQAEIWDIIQDDGYQLIEAEPILSHYYYANLLKHSDFKEALRYILSKKLATEVMPALDISEIIQDCYDKDNHIINSSEIDLLAVYNRDPATQLISTPLLYYKGYLALQAYRIAHSLWLDNREALAIFLQSQIAIVFGVDIHPAAKIGHGVMLDHATGIVIGETAVVENDVSILQSVTLGGTGKHEGDRHPKVREGVMIGANATILGNIEIGRNAKIGAGSVVLDDVAEHTTVAGVPAKVIGCPECKKPSFNMIQKL